MLIFICLFVVVGMMTLFTWFYNRQYRNNLSGTSMEIEANNQTDGDMRNYWISKSVFSNFSSHMIYVINIMTNQGKKIYNVFDFLLSLGSISMPFHLNQ
jgi:hypothetical protein